jgi:hypothetical protein
LDGNILDDPSRLEAERDSADRIYNDALTKLDGAIQRPPAEYPQPPRAPDDHQITPLNALWQIQAPPLPRRPWRRVLEAAVRRIVGPMFEQQQAFNSAVVDHINRNLPAERQSRQAIDATIATLRAHIDDLVRFESLLIVFLQQITPYVDTRDRASAGLLRGLSGAINAVADELMKRSEALLARDARREGQLAGLESHIAALQARLDELARKLEAS